jgi:hypothetical protein
MSVADAQHLGKESNPVCPIKADIEISAYYTEKFPPITVCDVCTLVSNPKSYIQLECFRSFLS